MAFLLCLKQILQHKNRCAPKDEKVHYNKKKMSLNVIKKVIDLGDGRTIEIETGKLAKQAMAL
jgi:hypothetical protein